MSNNHLILESSKEYELLDSGEGEKLERFGKFVLSRPDPQALWKKKLSKQDWKKAQGYFTREEKKGEWNLSKELPEKWTVELAGLNFWIKPTAFKHVGLFPEQASNWSWLSEKITNSIKKSEDFEVLNLFGYTGGASLAAAKAGAKVVHVDSSKVALTWARENAELSQLKDKPVRWLLDDAMVFVRREVKRGRQYKGIIMDPPSFGHGPNGELWKIENDFLPLLDETMKILDNQPVFFLLNGYSAGYSAWAYENSLQILKKKYGGNIESGELGIRESGATDIDRRTLPCGIFARWNM